MLISRYSPSNGRWTLSRNGTGASRFWHALLKRLATLNCAIALVLATLACAGQAQTKSNALPSITPAAAAHVEEDVRAFMRSVAHDVTQQGPFAWCNYFDDSRSFFMAVNGHLAFPNGAAAREGTQAFAKTIKHIELEWGGDNLRIDPLTPEFAVVATPWRETMVDSAGHRLDQAGFFSALAEYRDGHWQFRDAHWSSPVSP